MIFDKYVSRFNTAKERISELEDRSLEIIKTEIQGEKYDWKRVIEKTDHPRAVEY